MLITVPLLVGRSNEFRDTSNLNQQYGLTWGIARILATQSRAYRPCLAESRRSGYSRNTCSVYWLLRLSTGRDGRFLREYLLN